jgi:hypothetical protein
MSGFINYERACEQDQENYIIRPCFQPDGPEAGTESEQ